MNHFVDLQSVPEDDAQTENVVPQGALAKQNHKLSWRWTHRIVLYALVDWMVGWWLVG